MKIKQQFEQTLKKHISAMKAILNGIDQSSAIPHELLNELKQEFAIYSRLEERILYPKLLEFDDEEITDLTFRHREEHRLIEVLFDEIDKVFKFDPLWRARYNILKDLLLANLHREEMRLLKLTGALLTESQTGTLLSRMVDEERSLRHMPPVVG